jgi:uncharacterized membrane protein
VLDEDRARPSGHRVRGVVDLAVPEDLTRLVSLSDGVFAFAMTLLVLNLVAPTASQVPSNGSLWDYLRHQLEGTSGGGPSPFEVYAIGFLIIAIWWRLHVRIFRDLKAADSTIFWLDILYLLFIGITPFTINILLHFGQFPAAGAFYSGDQMLVGLIGAGIRLHCHRRPELCKGAPPTDRQVLALFATPGIFATSAAVALVSPVAAEVLWFAAIGVGAFMRRIDSAEKLRLQAGELG